MALATKSELTSLALQNMECRHAHPLNRTIAEAVHRFTTYTSGGNRSAIHPSLRLPVFRIAVSEGGHPAYEAVLREYATGTSIDGSEICLQSLGRVRSPSLVAEFLDFQFSDKVAIQDTHTGSIALAANPLARKELWAWIKENWERVHEKLSGNSVVLDRYLKNSLQKFASHDVEKDIADFFKDKNTKGYDRGLVQVSDTIRGNARYRERDEAVVGEWLDVHGYL